MLGRFGQLDRLVAQGDYGTSIGGDRSWCRYEDLPNGWNGVPKGPQPDVRSLIQIQRGVPDLELERIGDAPTTTTTWCIEVVVCSE